MNSSARRAALLGFLITLTFSGAAAQDGEQRSFLADLPPPGSVKLSQVIAAVEARPGFYAIKSVEFDDGEYLVIYFMADGAEVRLGYDAQTGDARPARRGGLFGG